ncbi:MAG TPA: cyclodeaminase/cyclohydrolase family protein [Candidatus Limnocylindrales bacterium]
MPSRRFADQSLRSFVDALASSEPVPGGGSAAAVAAAVAAGLVAMVAALSDRPRYAEHRSLHERVGGDARKLADRALALADEDAAAYATFAAALKLPRETEAESASRQAALAAAARDAAEVPYRSVQACREIAVAAEALAGRSNSNASSDLVVAGLLAEAAARAAARNVEVNLPSVADTRWAEQTAAETESLVGDTARLAAIVRDVVARGEARSPVDLSAARG